MTFQLNITIIIIFIVIWQILTSYKEYFTQINTYRYYYPDICSKSCCSIDTWKLPFKIMENEDILKGYTKVGSCYSGCRCRKNINQKTFNFR